jgi:polysaccharide chain length determinant protein (PEP-CTERM system associated)
VIPGKQYTPEELWSVARRRWWQIVLPFVLVSVGTCIVAEYLPNRYRSETLILVVPQRVPESYVRSTVTSRIEDRLQSISQQILSRTRLERIIQDFNLYVSERHQGIMEDVVDKMRRDIDVQIVKGDAFRVSYTGREPQTVMKVTERLASLFIEENLRDRAVLAEDSYEFLDAQLEEARRRLVVNEKQLEEYRRKFAGQLPTQLQGNLQFIQNTQLQIQALNESMARDRDRRLILERLIADALAPESVPAGAVQAASEAPAGTTAQQLEAARQSLRQLEFRLKPEHPDVVRLKRVIASLEKKAQAESADAVFLPDAVKAAVVSPAEAARANRIKEVNAELKDLDRQLARKDTEEKHLRAMVETYQVRVEATPTRESELIALTRDYETLRNQYASLLGKKEDSKISANLERRQIGEQFKILDPARQAEKPFTPNRPLIDMMGALFGLAFGVGLAALLDYSDSTIKTGEDVLQALSLPVLALVPMMSTDERRPSRGRRLAMLASSAAVVLTGIALMLWKFRF